MKTKNYIQSVSLLFFIVFSSQLFSQDNTSKKTTSLFLDSQKEIKPLNLTLIDTTNKISILNFKPKKIFFGIEPNIKKYFDPLNTNKKRTINFMSQTNKVDSDVLVKRFFNGKDMSNVKLTSDFNLGTLHSTSKSVRIEVRDHSLVDGDRIKVYVNEQIINSNIMLNGLYTIIYIDLKKGYNRIDIEAINEGYSGPNTAQLNVYDEKGNLLSSQDWNILTGQRATLGVVRN
ncbi:MAG: hypothetical protein L3J20_00440 [Flavobacteriaceae bacterium]|nr:hypothetical protein [Flavobacteriaceae bacterium]